MERRSDAEYEQRRGSARERGYTREWDRAAKAYRTEHPLCVGCLAVGRIRPATLVDHVIPHKGDQALFWDRSKWQSSCAWHHDVVKQMLEARYAEGSIDADALRLDSPEAVRLTRRHGTRISADGWPVET